MQPAPVIHFFFTISQCRSFSLARSDTSLFPEQDTHISLSIIINSSLSLNIHKLDSYLGSTHSEISQETPVNIPAQINCSFIMHKHLTPLDIGSYAAMHHQELHWYFYT